MEDPELIEKLGIVETEILGFGVTSKYQAYRLGKWFLATQKSDVKEVLKRLLTPEQWQQL